MSERNIIAAIENELKTIATARKKLNQYREDLARLYSTLNKELGEGVALKHESAIERPAEEEVLFALDSPRTMGQIMKTMGNRFTASQLRKVLAGLERAGKIKKSGERRGTTYAKK
jgi:hypothetical protein